MTHPQNFRPQLESLDIRLTPAAPVRAPAPLPEQFTATICDSEVEVTVLTNSQFTTTFSDGKVLTTGALKVQLTTEDGTSVVLNISGPGVVLPDGTSITYGPWVFTDPGILVQGRTVTQDGTFTVQGHQVDLCALLGLP